MGPIWRFPKRGGTPKWINSWMVYNGKFYLNLFQSNSIDDLGVPKISTGFKPPFDHLGVPYLNGKWV